MPAYFWDTSALVKRYFAEAGSKQVGALLDDRVSLHHVCSLIRPETVSAIVRRTSADEVAARIGDFERDAEIQLQEMRIDDALFGEAVQLVRKHRLRGCDALHLASALRLAGVIAGVDESLSLSFVCADDELNAAAVAEGLQVICPGK